MQIEAKKLTKFILTTCIFKAFSCQKNNRKLQDYRNRVLHTTTGPLVCYEKHWGDGKVRGARRKVRGK